MTLNLAGPGAPPAPDAHVLSRPRGRCRRLRRRFRTQVAAGLLSILVLAALGARTLIVPNPILGF